MQGESDRNPAGRPVSPAANADYSERLRTPWWWYPVALAVAVLLAAEFHIAGYSLTDWIPFSVLVPFSLIVVWWIGRSRLTITADEVAIRGARLQLRYVSGVVALDAVTLRRLIGREGDPQAFVAIRPWIGPGVQLQLDDPDDPTPYWVISTRHPGRVIDRLRPRR